MEPIVAFGPLAVSLKGALPEFPARNGGQLLDAMALCVAADAANVALARLGAAAHFIGSDVGGDPFGRQLLDLLRGQAPFSPPGSCTATPPAGPRASACASP